jgi:hypothetical protein
MKKKHLNRIKRELSQGLPDLFQKVNRVQYHKGEDIMEKGVNVLKDGKNVESGKMYVSITEGAHIINHERRIKKQFQRAGMAGVAAYRKAVLDYAEKHKAQTNG